MASRDPGEGEADRSDDPDTELRPVMQAQVVLERLGFGPGVIDGKQGVSLANALKGFQEARDLPVTGELDDATRRALAQWDNIAATRVVTIPKDWGDIPFVPIPADAAQQAELSHLGYENLAEKLAERFHTTVEVLKMLNPGGQPAGKAGSTTSAPEPSPSPTVSATSPERPVSTFVAGQIIRVPNIGGDRIAPGAVDDPDWQQTLQSLGVGTEQPDVEKIVVSKSEGTLKAYDEAGKLVVLFTVSSGSSRFPLPLGNWKINGKAPNPPFTYDPRVLGNDDDSGKQQLPPGPNSPVGVVWIDLSKEHYGIHGTPDPETIGRAQSSGCVRLTNWDAARLAQMVRPGVEVEFVA